jgi:hypothetical protein
MVDKLIRAPIIKGYNPPILRIAPLNKGGRGDFLFSLFKGRYGGAERDFNPFVASSLS